MNARQIVRDRLGVDPQKIDDFCRKWRIHELALFGSVLREDFRADSDVDFLLDWQEPLEWSLWDFIAMKEELSRIVGREVDLVSRRTLDNPFRRDPILRSRQVIYAA